jgi:uncharacterized repeat protein (TIGR03837 family)
MRQCDVFCKVVDNFGDIGVSWRLARQLATEHGWHVRLWVDNVRLAHRFADFYETEIEIVHWHRTSDFSQAADVVIETFACEVPEAYQQAMLAQQSLWLNVDYLSAEGWVVGFHTKPSPQANGLVRYFFYPGFSAETGGLIREANLAEKQAKARMQASAFWQRFGVKVTPETTKVSLFCYPQAPTEALFEVLAQSPTPIHCLIPEGVSVACKLTGKLNQFGNCTLQTIPFLSQDDYDSLLQLCDLNFVRGEDSWVRAIWAGKPFIWQPYQQAEDAHLKKLEAFLNRFYQNYEQQDMLRKAHGYWATGQGDKAVLHEYLQHLPNLQSFIQQQSTKLANQKDLATNLVKFCEN